MMLRPPSERSFAAAGLTALALAGLVAAVAVRQRHRPPRRPIHAPALAARTAAANARRGAALLAGSVLLDSATEHYRGEYHRPAMYLAPLAAGGTLAAALVPPEPGGRARQVIFIGAVLTGLAGHYFHARNIIDRSGSPSWESFFYAAPIGAPGALAVAGGAGLAASALEDARPEGAAARRAGRWLALGTAAGLLGTVAEVALLHFRGAFHNPVMYTPVVLPPLAAAAALAAARAPSRRRLRQARVLLRATAAMGLAGTAFHAWGVHRNMGGWRNWTQNLQVAPPLPAPPAFTGVALAGLGAMELLDGRRHR